MTLNKEQSEEAARCNYGPVAREVTHRLDKLVLSNKEARLYCHSRAVFPWRDPDPGKVLASKARTLWG